MENWENVIINEVCFSMRVIHGIGKNFHSDRQYHGFIFNGENLSQDYYFSDGTVLKTEAYDFFYLPKGSTYRVLHKEGLGDTFAINFNIEGDFKDKPFKIKFRDYKSVYNIFENCINIWLRNKPYKQTQTIKYLYELIDRCQLETDAKYSSSSQLKLIKPGVDEILNRYVENDLTILKVAKLCNISEVYFRKIFKNIYGISPSQYICELRIERAKQLLKNGFSALETAMLCGYGDATYFSREFKKAVGISPAQFKKQ